MLTVGSLFSGIGGLDLGLERAGMRVLWQCESDPYCRAVLRKHWPNVPCFEDVKTLLANTERTGREVAGHAEHDGKAVGSGQTDQPARGSVDVLAGGFPCQPVSLAGARRGNADARWLWPEYARLIRLLRPRYALMENVPGLLVGGGMAEVLGDLAEMGYDSEWGCVAAADVGAPHLRKRIFIVAYPHGYLGRASGARGMESRPANWTKSGGESLTDAYGGRFQERQELDSEASQDAPHGHPRRGHADRLRDEVADPRRERDERWGGLGDLDGTQGAREGEAPKRQRVRDATDDRGSVVAHAAANRREPRRARDASQDEGGWEPDRSGGGSSLADSDDSRSQGRNERERGTGQRLAWPSRGTFAGQWLVEPDVGRVAHGIPSRVERLRALGNAVVPQVAEVIGRMIVNAEFA